ncbi:MAG TPA: hypothetical protein VEL76_17355 [Gemmataceae bacterium]|nr:hypothetical protein [Gemmataceae bacterium]
MPITFTCPVCERRIAVNEHLAGLRHRCPECQNMVTVPGGTSFASSPPPAAKEFPGADPYPPAPSIGRDYGEAPAYAVAGWGVVPAGLGVMRIAIIVFLVAMVLQLLLGLIQIVTLQSEMHRQIDRFNPPGPRSQAFFETASTVLAWLARVALVVYVIGLGFLCAAPDQSQIKGKAILGLVCGLVCLLCQLIVVLLSLKDRHGDVGGPGGPLVFMGDPAAGLPRDTGPFVAVLLFSGLILGFLAAMNLSVLCYSGIGQACNRPGLSGSANGYLATWPLLVIGAFLFFMLLTMSIQMQPGRGGESAMLALPLMMIVMCMVVITVMALWQITLINGACNAIGRQRRSD